MNTREALRSIGIVNTHDVLVRFAFHPNEALSIRFFPVAERSVRPRGASVYSPKFQTDPGAIFPCPGQKFFTGSRSKAFAAAEAWASEMWGVTSWAPCPTNPNARIPTEVRARALAAAKAAKRKKSPL